MEFHLNNNGSSARGLIKINQHMQDDRKEVSSRITGEKEHISQEDESKLNEDAVGVNGERQMEAMHFKVCTPIGLQRSHQESQELAVCWERFLPLRSLKVLLVENDDSTRHVVSALLRNCGYEVAAVANGMQALKILVDVTSKVDLVLTEVVTPLLSGIGLLSKMTTHKNCNNIPVIMMSSHDSMSIVFKCLSKGAVDFLVKPIRKNELKNLWQHVWRKCHSYSGIHTTKKCTRSRSAEESDNNSGSNGEDDNGSSRLNFRDGSDNGSGTQSSWTKRAVEVDSPKPMSSWDQLADPPDSTCAQVIHSDPEALGNDWFPMTSTRGCESQEKELDLEIRRPRVQNVPLEIARNKSLAFVAGTNMDRVSETKSNKNDKHVENGHIDINVEGSRGKSKNQASTQLRFMENDCDPGIESALVDVPIGNFKNSVKKDGMTRDNNELPSLELSLKRLQDVRDIGTSGPVRNTLRHSDLSAFSRYNSIAVANQTHARNHSYSRIDNSSEAPKTESMQNLQSYSLNTPLNQQSNGSSNNNDVGSTTDNVFNKPMATEFQLMTSGKSETELASTSAAKFKGANLVRTTNHHHCHHHVVDIPDQLQLANNGELSQKNVPATDLHCGSSNTLNGSATGSNFGSNGIEGSCAAFNAKESNMEIENRLTGKDEAICGLGSERKSGPDQNRSAQREAALNKFRQKRKERCFEKKVRYHSRKKLAEQRPRIRGQFVRQALPKDKDEDKDKDKAAHS